MSEGNFTTACELSSRKWEEVSKTLNIFSNGDHRIAMSWAILGLVLEGKLKIHNFETVDTSFPNFIKLIRDVGGKIEIKKN